MSLFHSCVSCFRTFEQQIPIPWQRDGTRFFSKISTIAALVWIDSKEGLKNRGIFHSGGGEVSKGHFLFYLFWIKWPKINLRHWIFLCIWGGSHRFQTHTKLTKVCNCQYFDHQISQSIFRVFERLKYTFSFRKC